MSNLIENLQLDYITNAQASTRKALTDVLCIPFELTRHAYAQSVRLGLLPKSILACRDFSNALYLAEKTTLGPLARSR